jgi:hypothetical protein
MTNPAKVFGFRDVAGDWNSSLALAILVALVVTAPIYAVSRPPRLRCV